MPVQSQAPHGARRAPLRAGAGGQQLVHEQPVGLSTVRGVQGAPGPLQPGLCLRHPFACPTPRLRQQRTPAAPAPGPSARRGSCRPRKVF